MKNLLEFENLGRRFSGRWALQGASGKLYQGDKVALLGHNGAGKTTLLYLLAGVLRPDTGAIRRQHPPLGILSHHPMLYSRLSALDNLLFFLKLSGLSHKAARQRARDNLEFFGLKARKDDRPDTFSRGMLQRLLLARISALRPELLLLDEPFTGLDVQAQQLLESIIARGGIAELQWSFSTMILVDHDIGRTRTLCSRVWQMERGELCEEK